jgi:hypothetical protein
MLLVIQFSQHETSTVLSLTFLGFLLQFFTMLHAVLVIMFPEEHTSCVFSRLSQVDVVCFLGTACTYKITWCQRRRSCFRCIWIEKEVVSLLWNSSFGTITSNTIFCRNKIPFSH